jgi:transposase
MDKRFQDWDVEQAWLFPPSVLDLVPADHPAHFVRELVRAELDLSAIYGDYAPGAGAPPYHPAMMTALLLYGYSRGVYSSRKLQEACRERVDFMAVTGRQEPNFRTINTFRGRHLDALGELFVQVLDLCRRAGLARLNHVSLDGTKMRANASKHKAMSYGRMKQEERRLREQVDRWLEQAEAIDEAEDELYGAENSGLEMPAWVADKHKRAEKIAQAKAELEAEAKAAAAAKAKEQAAKPPRKNKGGPRPKPPSQRPPDKAQRNFTDPESRIMRTRQTHEQAYNCQAAVDADSHVIVARSVSNQQSDMHELVPILDQIKRNVGRQARELSADMGYCCEENLKTLKRRRIRGYVATGRRRHRDATPTSDPWRMQQPYACEMRTRLRRGGHRSRYRLRKQTPEPVFGQIKEARGFRQFLMRGLDKVRREWSLICTAHNLLKLQAARA